MTSNAPGFALASVVLPIGTILPCIQVPKSLPAGWLPCDGSAIPPQYQELSTLLGSLHTPNLIGRTLIGAGDLTTATQSQTDGLDPNFSALGPALQIGNIGGECRHTLSVDEIPKHVHTINHGDFGVHGRSFEGAGGNDKPFETSPHTHLTNTDFAGGGRSHYNVQPYFAVTYMIFAGI